MLRSIIIFILINLCTQTFAQDHIHIKVEEEVPTAWYHLPGSVVFSAGISMFNLRGVVTIPVQGQLGIMLPANLELNAGFTYFRQKEAYASQFGQGTFWSETDITYNHYSTNLRLNYHYSEFFLNLFNLRKPSPEKFDLYLFISGGYDWLKPNATHANWAYINQQKGMFIAAGGGLRGQVTPMIGFFIEGAYSPHGFVQLGTTIAFNRKAQSVDLSEVNSEEK